MSDALTHEWPDVYDHVITDPPYSAHTHRTGATMRGGKARRNHFGFGSLTPALRDKIADLVVMARSWSVVFCDDRSISTWIDAVESRGGKFIRSIPWVRWSMPQLSGDRPPQGWECVLIFWGKENGRKSWNGPGNLTHFSDKCMRGPGKHKTQKPLSLMLKIVSYFTRPDAVILEPCAGRGTTAAAALALGRACVFTEIDAAEERAAKLRCQYPPAKDLEDIAAHIVHLSDLAANKERMRGYTAKIRAKHATP